MDKDDKPLAIRPENSLSAGINLPKIFQHAIGKYDFNEPDFNQILLWSKKSGLSPDEVVQRLEQSRWKNRFNNKQVSFEVVNGSIGNLIWDFDYLPINPDDWVEGLSIQQIYFVSTKRFDQLELAPKLKYLRHFLCDEIGVTKIDLSAVPSLTELRCDCNQLTNLDLTNVKYLSYLNCSGNHLTDLRLESVPALKTLICTSNRLTSLNLTSLSELLWLECGHNQLTTLSLPNLRSLAVLTCDNNQLTSLDLSEVPALEYLLCNDNHLAELDLSSIPSLRRLICYKNRLSKLDLSLVPSLTRLKCNYNKLAELNISSIKNNSMDLLLVDQNVKIIDEK